MEGRLRRKTGEEEKEEKNKVKEFQLAKPASLGSLASKNQSVAWYACEASLGKERCVRQGWISPYKFLVPCLSVKVKFTKQ